MTATDDGPVPDEMPSGFAFRVGELSRPHLTLHSFNAAPQDPPSWWIKSAFAEPTGGWPKDRPLVAECVQDWKHEPHKKDCPEDCEEHTPGIPSANCKCGMYATRDLENVINHYLQRATVPVLGLVELGGAMFMGEPGHQAYARAEYCRVAAVLLIDKWLATDHDTLRRLASDYNVPALVPHSVDPDDYQDRITVTTTLADEAEAFLRKLQEGGL